MATTSLNRHWLVPQDGDPPPDWGNNLRTIINDLDANALFSSDTQPRTKPFGAKLTHTLGVTVTTSDTNLRAISTYSASVFNTEFFNSGGTFHSTSLNPARITIPVQGLYHVGFNFHWASNATGLRLVSIFANGSSQLIDDTQAAVTGVSTICKASAVIQLNAADVLEPYVAQSSGGSLATSNAGIIFWAVMMGIAP